MTQAQVKPIVYFGYDAVTLGAGPYEATILPDIGGNLISFRDTERNLDFLRAPAENELASFENVPYVYGIPVLFPPNRYEDGRFHFQGKTYHFPVNEAATNNHLHGFVYNVPWRVIESGTADNEQAFAVVQLRVDEAHPIYTHFPHCFTIQLRYELSQSGLCQHVAITNDGSGPMPCLLAFHTTVNVPFSAHSAEDDYVYQATIGERWELNERKLPTTVKLPLSVEEQRIRADGINPFFEEMDNHYTAEPNVGKNYMKLTDTRLNLSLVYDVGIKFRNWMIWNNFANGQFFCPEPQTSVINAPNLPLPDEVSGMITLASGECWSETSRFYVEEGSA